MGGETPLITMSGTVESVLETVRSVDSPAYQVEFRAQIPKSEFSELEKLKADFREFEIQAENNQSYTVRITISGSDISDS
jgi:hypothetical protein